MTFFYWRLILLKVNATFVKLGTLVSTSYHVQHHTSYLMAN